MGITKDKSPFKFLDAYEERDQDIFFGREAETEELYDRVFETNLVLLYGASGTGKTSLINCGLYNKFDKADWHPILIRRKDNIISSWRNAVTQDCVKKIKKEANFAQMIRSLYLDYFKPIYLIFDQFEELFILGKKEEQTTFFEEIKSLLASGIQCKVIISMREEYIAHLSDYEKIVPFLFNNRQRIELMKPNEIKEVISGTAEAFDIEIINDEKVVESIMDNLKDKRGIDLANLQVYLDRLYKVDLKRRGNRKQAKFDMNLVNKVGPLEDVLSLFLEDQVMIIERELSNAPFNISQKGIPMSILFELVTDNGTKKQVNLKSMKQYLIHQKNISGKVIDHCIQRFFDLRILKELSSDEEEE